MPVNVILYTLGELFGWKKESREFISTVNKDGESIPICSRISNKVWNHFLEGINVRLFRKLEDIKRSEKKCGSIEADMFYKGNKKQIIRLSWDMEAGAYLVECETETISYGDLDRAMLMFSLKLETLMRDRMTATG